MIILFLSLGKTEEPRGVTSHTTSWPWSHRMQLNWTWYFIMRLITFISSLLFWNINHYHIVEIIDNVKKTSLLYKSSSSFEVTHPERSQSRLSTTVELGEGYPYHRCTPLLSAQCIKRRARCMTTGMAQ